MVDPNKVYENNILVYRFLLDSATAAAIRLLRIRVHISGMEKLPKDEKVLFVGNHRSNFDPRITWNALKAWKIVYLDVLEVLPGENIKEMKTEMIGMTVRHLIITNTEKRDAIWQKDM